MRPRAKSMSAARAGYKSENEQSSFYENDESQLIMEGGWTAEEIMKLIRRVFQQIPKNDNISYDARIDKINWNLVAYENRSATETKEQFEKLLRRTRNFRLLSEILTDIEKDVFSSLSLPKRPVSAFVLFLQDQKQKDQIKENLAHSEDPSLKGSFGRLASEAFKKLNRNERDKYQKMADEMKKDYKNVISKFKLESKTHKSDSTEKPAGLFWSHMKEKDEELTFQEARKMYMELSNKKKLKYILRFLGVNHGDKLTLDQYKMALEKLTKEELNIIDDYEGRPKKMSAYACFLKDYLAEQKQETGEKSNFTLAAEKWKTLPQEDKKPYEEKAERLKSMYNDAYMDFLKSLEPLRQVFEVQRVVTKKTVNKRKTTSANNTKLSFVSDDSVHEKGSRRTDEAMTSTKHEIISQINSPKYISEDIVAVSPLKKQNRKGDISDEATPSTSKKERQRKYTSETDHEQSANDRMDLQQKQHNVKRNISDSESVPSPKKKKRITNVSDSSFHESEDFKTPIKIFKREDNNSISNDESSLSKKIKQKKCSVSGSDFEEREERKNTDLTSLNASTIILRKKPPGSVFKYYVKEIYEGSPQQAKQTYKKLSSEEKEKINTKYRKAQKKYKKWFKKHVEALTPEEFKKLEELAKNLKNSDDEISDLTLSDSSSD